MKYKQESNMASIKEFYEVKDMSYGSFWHNGDYLLYLHCGSLYLFNYSQVMMLSDTVSSRCICVLALSIYDHLELNHMPRVSTLLSIYKWGDDILWILGNDAYSVIKCFEAVCTGYIIDIYDPLKSGAKYLNEIIHSVDHVLKVNSLKRLTEIIKTQTKHPNHIIEMFGCYKHFGHPIVDEIEGINDLKSNTRIEIKLDKPLMKQISGAFNRMFIINFIKKNQRWPKCNLVKTNCLQQGPYSLNELLLKKHLSLNLYDSKIKVEEWSYIVFEKELEFDDFSDFTKLVLDTAISPYRENFYNVYHKDTVVINKPKELKESRRTLLEILSRKTSNIRN